MIQLSALLSGIDTTHSSTPADPIITGMTYDSRTVQPGSLFVAIKGYHSDGHAYIPQALERGAAAVVVDARHYHHSTFPDQSIPCVAVPNSRVVLAPLAAALHGYPSRLLGVVGVTGTKGKTTTTTLVSHVLDHAGHTTGRITTVDFKIASRQWANALRQSTPEAPEIQAMLRQMVDAGCDYAVIEASSHGLSPEWNRLGHCAFDVAVLTNVTHEHLDYHGSVEQYRRDKTRLFALLGEDAAGDSPLMVKRQKYALVNADDPHHQMFLDAAPTHAQRLTYALHTSADVRGEIQEATPDGTRMRVSSPWGSTRLALRLPGAFNASNALAALCAGVSQGVSLEQAAAALEQVQGVRGRMERIQQGQPFGVLVDYAHNPDSFEQVMGMLRPLTPGRMIAVFGSAGERDVEKRPLQGAIAAHFCDMLVLTDEDPRGEDPEAIITAIARGAEQAGKQRGTGYLLIPDRTAAIRAAFGHARAGDLVLLLGKGHEGSIEYASGKQPWDEAAEARAALREMGYNGA